MSIWNDDDEGGFGSFTNVEIAILASVAFLALVLFVVGSK